MVIRGAPAIGVAAAMGIALGMRKQQGDRHAEVRRRVLQDLRADGGDAADRRQPVLGDRADEAGVRGRRPRRASRSTRSRIASTARRRRFTTRTSRAAARWARSAPRRAGRRAHPDALQRRRAGDGRLRHGARRHSRRGRGRASTSTVFADETRPFLQGARLTAWELVRDGIQTTVITDNMAGALMRQGQHRPRRRRRRSHRRQRRHRQQDRHLHAWPCWRASTSIPFYVAAPLSTIDLDTPDGAHIPIEERNAREVTHVGGSAADAGRRARSGIRRSTSRRITSSPASSPSAASSARRTPRSLARAFARPRCTKRTVVATDARVAC